MNQRRIFVVVASILGPAVTFMGAVGYVEANISMTQTVREIVLASSLATIFVGALVAWVWREILVARKTRYAAIFRHVHSFHHSLRNLSSYVDEVLIDLDQKDAKAIAQSRQLIRSEFISALDQVQAIFEMLTGTGCRACVKAIYEHEGVAYLETLFRNKSALDEWQDLDNDRREKHADPVDDNIIVGRVLARRATKLPGVIINDLVANKSLHASSAKNYEDAVVKGNSGRWMGASSAIPYRAMAVYAIRQTADDGLVSEDRPVLGFLGVDSESRNVFVTRWDLNLLASLSDALYHPVNKYLAFADIATAKLLKDRANRQHEATNEGA